MLSRARRLSRERVNIFAISLFLLVFLLNVESVILRGNRDSTILSCLSVLSNSPQDPTAHFFNQAKQTIFEVQTRDFNLR